MVSLRSASASSPRGGDIVVTNIGRSSKGGRISQHARNGCKMRRERHMFERNALSCRASAHQQASAARPLSEALRQSMSCLYTLADRALLRKKILRRRKPCMASSIAPNALFGKACKHHQTRPYRRLRRRQGSLKATVRCWSIMSRHRGHQHEENTSTSRSYAMRA